MTERMIGTLAQIPKGEGRNFAVDGVAVAVFRTRADAVFATQAECPHRAGPLADGMVDAGTVTCPLHERVYALATGEGIGTACALRTYRVRVDGAGMLHLALEAATAPRESVAAD